MHLTASLLIRSRSVTVKHAAATVPFGVEFDHQMNMFEDFIGYQGSAVLDEPVREEDSFSKESMSQESEISENILLPDLAKQSESIEQQSGEIAERGMPT